MRRKTERYRRKVLGLRSDLLSTSARNCPIVGSPGLTIISGLNRASACGQPLATMAR